MTIVLQIYPNGEFTHGVDSSQRRHRNPRPQTSPPPEVVPVGDSVCLQVGDVCGRVFPQTADIQPGDTFENQHGDTFTYLCADMGKHLYAFESADGSFVTVTDLWDSVARIVAQDKLTPIGLSAARNLKKMPGKRRTPLRMTKRMARGIRNAGHILQSEFGKDNLSFLTLTLPDLCEEDLHKVCANWGSMVHKFLVWLRYRVEKFKMPLRYVHCTEIQTSRLESRNEYAPHLHLLFRGRCGKKSSWAITPLMARKQWVRCLKSVLNHTNFTKSALENLQRVRHNAAGYLSKYMSKGNCSLPSGDGGDTQQVISTDWGGMDRTTSQEITSRKICIRGDGKRRDACWLFIRQIPLLIKSGIIAFYKAGFIVLSPPTDNQPPRGLKVGVGRIAVPVDETTFDGIIEFLINNCDNNLTEIA